MDLQNDLLMESSLPEQLRPQVGASVPAAITPTKSEEMACCCVSDRQRSPDVGDKAEKTPTSGDDHYYEPISPVTDKQQLILTPRSPTIRSTTSRFPLKNKPVILPKPSFTAKLSNGTQTANNRDLSAERVAVPLPPLPLKLNAQKITSPPPVPPKPKLSSPLTSQTCTEWPNSSPAQSPVTIEPKTTPELNSACKPPTPAKPPIASKPAIAPKPKLTQALPGDSLIFSAHDSSEKPTRPPRSRQNSLKSLVSAGKESDAVSVSSFARSGSDIRILPGLPCRKSASLGRLEALKCALAVSNHQSSSVDALDLTGPLEGRPPDTPSAPPRRKKALDDEPTNLISTPVYAKVDLSKKTKKSAEGKGATVSKKLEDIPSAKEIIKEIQAAINKGDGPRRNICSRSSSWSVVSQSLEVIVEVSPSVTDSGTDGEVTVSKEVQSSVGTPDAVTVSENFSNQLWEYAARSTCETSPQTEVSAKSPLSRQHSCSDSDIDSNLLKIEHTVAAINSVVCSLHDERKLDLGESEGLQEPVIIEAYNTIIRTDAEIETSCSDDVTTPNSIARLVVSGSVVSPQEECSLVKPLQVVKKTKHKMKEFGSVLEDTFKFECPLPPVVTDASSQLANSGTVQTRCAKENSPAPSVTSTSSTNSDFSVLCSVFEDDLSTGALADVDTSDVTRQNSFEESYPSNAENDAGHDTEGFVAPRPRNTAFAAAGKNHRRNAVRRKTKPPRSSTESEVDSKKEEQKEKRVSGVNKYHPVRPAPVPPPGKVDCSVSLSNTSAQSVGFVQDLGRDIEPTVKELVRLSSAVMTADLSHYSTQSSEMPCPLSPAGDSDTVSVRSGTDSVQLSATGEDSTVNVSDSENEEELPVTEDFIAQSIADPKRRKVYYIAKEIASSERVFVNCLALLTQEFPSYVKAAALENKTGIIPDGDLERLLTYLPQLYDLNVDLLRDLEARVQNWLQDPRLADVIVKKGPFLKLYSTYIQNFRSQSAFFEESCQKYPLFAATVKAFEKLPRCQNLALHSYFLKPIQRIPQYRLLLADYKKNLEEDSPDYNDTIVALQVVSEVAEHANNSMKLGDYVNMLFRLQSRLGSYAIIQPGRQLIREGELLKLSRKSMQPRYFILLNDCLLYTSYVGTPAPNCNLKVHSELPLEGMRVCLPLGTAPDYQHEFNVISNTRSFTLCASSDELRDAWLAALTQAIGDHNDRQSSFQSAKGLAKAPKLGQQAPIWIHDNRVTMCQLCTAEFTVTFRRHHCRACGKVICSNCSCRRAPLEYLRFQRARVCDECYAQLHNTESYSGTSFGHEDPDYADLGDFDSPRRPSSDDVTREPANLAGMKAQARRKEKRMIPDRLIVSANDAGSQMSGFLWKRSRRSNWKKAWFVLKDKVLYSYKASEDVVALESIPVLGYEIANEVPPKLCDGCDPKLVFELLHTNSNVSLIFRADNPVLANRWVEAMSEAVILS